MFKRIWPIVLILAMNTLYQICAKEVPSDMDAFASLSLAYLVSCATCFICYFLFRKVTGSDDIASEYRKLNWAPFLLGFAVAGLEFGWLMAYRAGWQVSTGYIVVTAVVACALLALGGILYKEKISRNKLIGVALCLIGLVIINL